MTEEQSRVVDSQGNVAVDAAPGSGKTTVLIEYAKARRDKRILYLVYNKAMQEEAKAKFEAAGLTNVDCRTPHSIAYQHSYKKCSGPLGFKDLSFAVVKELIGNPLHDASANLQLVKHVRGLLSYFFNSEDTEMRMREYFLSRPEKERGFIRTYEGILRGQMQAIYKLMESKKIGITQDFCLKYFQLSNIILGYDIILFDEAQDATGSMLAVVNQQRCTKVFVGDSDQQIYSWRYAINALGKLGPEYQRMQLTNSFRFGQEIADEVNRIASLKRLGGKEPSCTITGCGGNKNDKSMAILGRTNAALLGHALESDAEKIYFEGKLSKYLISEDNSYGIFDIANQLVGNKALVRSNLIQALGSKERIFEYAKEVEDNKLSSMAMLVTQYERGIFHRLLDLKKKEVLTKTQAEICYASAHKAKGCEFGTVELLQDGFVTNQNWAELVEKRGLDSTLEEVNIHFVAASRAIKKLVNPNETEKVGQ